MRHGLCWMCLSALLFSGCLTPIVEPADTDTRTDVGAIADADSATMDVSELPLSDVQQLDSEEVSLTCDPPCPAWQACASGSCGVKACTAHSDCNADPVAPEDGKHWCYKGKCMGYQCATDADCPGQLCSKFTYECYDIPKGCTSVAQCDDGDPCTLDTCNLSNACEHKSLTGCCTKDYDCNDNNGCTLDKCTAGKCDWTPQGVCCQSDKQCDDGQPCTQDLCNGGVCAHKPAPNCCLNDGECDDGIAASTDKCASGKCIYVYPGAATACPGGTGCTVNACTSPTCVGGFCSYGPTKQAPGCCTQDNECGQDIACKVNACLAQTCTSQAAVGSGTHKWMRFNTAAIDSWTVEQSSKSVYFHFDATNKVEGAGALRYGVPGKISFEDQTSNKGAAFSPPLTLPTAPGLKFWVLLDVSPGSAIHQAGIDVVDATTKAPLAAVWSKNSNLNTGTTGGKWLQQQVMVPANLAGKSVRLKVWFDQVKFDTSNKQKLGLLVDDLQLTGACP